MSQRHVSCRDVETLRSRRNDILTTIDASGYVIIRGLFEEARIAQMLRAIYLYANSARHRPSYGLSPVDVRHNTSKWSIGGRASQDGLGRFAVVVYNPLIDGDQYGLHAAFERIIQVRDTLAGRDILWDSALLPERFNACRVQIYPAGGGFLAEHRDARGLSNLPAGIFLEVLLLLTQKGIDYKTGGGFVRFNGNVLDSEVETRRGDLVVYSSSTIHGVLDVDPELSFDVSDLRGRAVAMATIYDNH